jgi:DNA-binding Lrp family transcriptional regulator
VNDLDVHLLKLLQVDASTSHAELAQATGLSVTGVHKRLKRLRQEGYIRKITAVLDRGKLGLDLLCFLKATFKNNLEPSNIQNLRQAMAKLPEVLECYSLTGSTDAIIKVLVADHVALREFLVRLSKVQQVIDRVETCIVLEEFKEGYELPIAGDR